PLPLPELRPINRRLMAANQARGLRPFRLPLAIDFSRCLNCDVCPGFVCPTGARRSSIPLLDRAAAEGNSLQLMTHTEAQGFCIDGRIQVRGGRLRNRSSGRIAIISAKRYALAAGALHSPLLLQKSGLDGPLVGRNYMFHLSPIAAGIFSENTQADVAFIKQ